MVAHGLHGRFTAAWHVVRATSYKQMATVFIPKYYNQKQGGSTLFAISSNHLPTGSDLWLAGGR